MDSSNIRLTLLFTITVASLYGINGQLFTIATRLAEVIPLLKNVTNTSATMQSFLPQLAGLLKNQEDVQILTNILLQNNTVSADQLASILPGIEDILQNQQDKQDQVVTLLQNQQENHDQTLTLLQNQQNTLNLLANYQSQMVTFLHLQSQQLENMTAALSHMVVQLNTQNQLISRLPVAYPKDCSELLASGPYSSGSYTLRPWDELGDFQVHCDMDTTDDGWTVFQRRFDGTVDFFLEWQAYEDGFGTLDGEYWLGLRQIRRLTREGDWTLRIDLEDFEGNTAYAEYQSFSVGDAASLYRLSIGAYSGTAGDSLRYHNSHAFSTSDRDSDQADDHSCAQGNQGSWWYSHCAHSNLNGLYLGPSQFSKTGMYWWHWNISFESLKRSEMKMLRIMIT